MNNKIKMTSLVSLVLLLFSLNTFSILNNSSVEIPVYIITAFIPSIVFFRNEILHFYRNNLKNKEFLLLYIFFFLVLISEITNGRVQDSLYYLLVFPLIFIMFIKSDIKKLYISSLLSIIPFFILIVSLILKGHKFTSNSGSILVTLIPVIIFRLYTLAEEGNKTKVLILLLISYIISVFISFYIGSRTSQLQLFSFVIFVVFYFFMKTKKKFTLPKNISKIIFVIILLLVFIISLKFIPIITTAKWRPNDISSGRFNIWKKTFQQLTLMGHDYTWYKTEGLIGPHNLYVGILGYSGIIPFSVLVYFIYHLVSKVRFQFYTHLPSIVVILTIHTIGLTEGMILMPFYSLYNLLLLIEIFQIIKAQSISIMESNLEILFFKLLPSILVFFVLLSTIFLSYFDLFVQYFTINF